MVALPLRSYLFHFVSNFPFRITNHLEGDIPMVFLCSFFVFFTFSVLLLSFSLYKKLKRIEFEHRQLINSQPGKGDADPIDIKHYIESSDDSTNRPSRACLTHSLLFEILPPDSPKWESLFVEEGHDEAEPDSKGFGSDKEVRDCGQEQGGKRKKKRAKKKRSNSQSEDGGGDESENWGMDLCASRNEHELTLLYPFTTCSSVMQRKIKEQYDELMKCQKSKELTLAQVRQFANCLINARSKLQHKADVIHRKFTITRALLYKADRSSFDRLRQQIYKLELEQKRLEEDTFVYNWLQQQLKFSPAYKKMLEIGTCTGLMEEAEKPRDDKDSEFGEMSFEELLAQEKKDSFWHRNGKLRSCSS